MMSTEAGYEAAPGSLGEKLLNVDRSLYNAIHEEFPQASTVESFVLPIRSGALPLLPAGRYDCIHF